MASLKLLGTGSAFNLEAGNVSAVVEGAGYCALIDCGMSVPAALMKHGLLNRITHVFITHTHADHVGGLELFAQWRFFVAQRQGIAVPKLVVHADILAKLRHLEQLGLSKIQDDFGRPVDARLETYFDVETPFEGPFSGYSQRLVPRGGSHAFVTDRNGYELGEGGKTVTVVPFPVQHVPGDFPSYGFGLHGPNQTILWTGDTRESQTRMIELVDPNLIFHDCQLFVGPNEGKGDVHANLWQLERAMTRSQQEGTFLIHYGANVEQHRAEAMQMGFLGFAEPGQSFDL